MVTDTFLPLERRHTMRSSDVQVAVTLFSVLTLLSNSLRHLVRFSVMRSFYINKTRCDISLSSVVIV